jgi:hypothetical protein
MSADLLEHFCGSRLWVSMVTKGAPKRIEGIVFFAESLANPL